LQQRRQQQNIQHPRSPARRPKIFLARLRLSLVNVDVFAEIDFLAARPATLA
jgi:hypothetical protein